jgi:hypothetical protein
MGVQIPEIEQSTCDAAFFQYEWQTADHASREEVAVAIAQAEAEIEATLRYRLLPSWEEQEYHMTVRPRIPEQVFTGYGDLRGYSPAIETDWKRVISGGRRAKVLVEAGVAVAYASTANPATWKDTATVTVNVPTGTSACEVALFMPGQAGDDRYRIRPVTVSLAGLVATITFKRELGVLPALQEAVASGGNFVRPVTGTDDANFITTVDVYRIYNSGETQASLIWIPPNSSCSTCAGSGCINCLLASQTGCLVVRNPLMGQVGYTPATWDAAAGAFDAANYAVNRRPDAIEAYYYAGLLDRSRPCPYVEMAFEWERTVAILAAARLSRPVCECGSARAYVDYWQRNAAFRPGDGSGFDIELRDLGNPFGTRVGEIFAWKQVSRPGVRVANSA